VILGNLLLLRPSLSLCLVGTLVGWDFGHLIIYCEVTSEPFVCVWDLQQEHLLDQVITHSHLFVVRIVTLHDVREMLLYIEKPNFEPVRNSFLGELHFSGRIPYMVTCMGTTVLGCGKMESLRGWCTRFWVLWVAHLYGVTAF